MKKLLLTLGTLAAVAAPVTAVVACGSTKGGPTDNDIHNRDRFKPSVTKGGGDVNIPKDLARPYNDVATTQTKDTKFQSGLVEHKDATVAPIVGDEIDLNPILTKLSLKLDEISDVSFSIGSSYQVSPTKIVLSKFKNRQKSGVIRFGNTDYYNDTLVFTLQDDGIIKITNIPRYSSKEVPFVGDSRLQMKNFSAQTRVQPYWASQIPTKITPTTFYWDADKCNSLDDIFNQMNSQLHFFFQKKIENMNPIDLANYVVNLAKNNGGGDWTFIVNYKGKSTKAVVPTAATLSKFITALDGDDNPDGKSGEWYKAVSPSTPRGSNLGSGWGAFLAGFGSSINNLDAPTFLQMLEDHSKWLPANRVPIFELLQNFPAGALNVFPDFLDLFMNVAHVFIDDDVCKAWAADQDPIVQEQYKNIIDIFVKKVLASGS